MRAYTVPTDSPFARCWRNSVTGGPGPRAGRPLLLGGGDRLGARGGRRRVRLDGPHVAPGVVLDLEDHRRLHRVVVGVDADDAGDALEALGRLDRLADGGAGEVLRAV